MGVLWEEHGEGVPSECWVAEPKLEGRIAARKTDEEGGSTARDQWTSVPSWLRSQGLWDPSLSLLLLPLHESKKYTTFSLRESYISFLVPAWHFHMCSICQSPKPETLVSSTIHCFHLFPCGSGSGYLDGVKEASPHSLQLFLLRPLSKYLFSMYARGTPSFNPTFQNSSSLTWSITIIYFPIIYLLTKYLGCGLSHKASWGASVAVACGLSSCGPRGLGFSKAYGIVHGHVG